MSPRLEPLAIQKRAARWEVLDAVPEAICVLDEMRTKVLSVNREYVERFGEPTMTLAELHPLRIIEEDSRATLLELGDPGSSAPSGAEVYTTSPEGRVVERVHARFAQIDGESVWLYSFRRHRPNSEQLESKENVARQKRLTSEAIKHSVQIYYLTDRIRSAPKLAAHLLGAEDLDDLFEKASAFLRAEGFNCREVSIILIRGEHLDVAYNSRGVGEELLIAREADYRRFLETGVQPADPSVRFNRLQDQKGVIGILDLSFHLRELAHFADSPQVNAWHDDLLVTIAEITALFISNLRLVEELKTLTIEDTATGVYNRRFLESQLDFEMHRLRRSQSELSIIFLDLDGFKELNDKFGHRAGDRVLNDLAILLSESVRSTDFVCRYGGDEFVLIFPDTPRSAAIQKADFLRALVERSEFEGLEGAHLTLSIGVASTIDFITVRDFLNEADQALYRAKRKGRNCVYATAEDSPGDDSGSV